MPIERRSFLTTLAAPLALAAQNGARNAEVNVLDFGAAADGRTVNTKAMQEAIETAYRAGGGRVVVPPGVFVTGTIRLRSNVSLYLAPGATLKGSPNAADYPKDAGLCDWHPKFPWGREFTGTLIYAEGASNIALEGPGTADGSQTAGKNRTFPNAGDPEHRRPMLVRFRDCTHVRVRDVTLTNPASFTTLFVGCSDVYIDNVRVRSRATGNGDGFDFDGCQRVRISNCDLDTGDDTIGLKSMIPDRPVEDFVITNCILSSSWAAVRLGPESFRDMRHIAVSNCVFRNCRDGFKIQSCEGAVMERLLFSNIVMENVLRPFFVTLNAFSMSRHAPPGRVTVGQLRDMHATNIRAVVPKNPTGHGYEQPCVAFAGYPGRFIEDISISGFDLTMPGGGTEEQARRFDIPELLDEEKYYPEAVNFEGELPASGIYLRHVRGVRLTDCRITTAAPDARAYIAGDDWDDVAMNGVTGAGSDAAASLVKYANGRRVNLVNCGVKGADRPLVAKLSAAEEAKLAAVRRK